MLYIYLIALSYYKKYPNFTNFCQISRRIHGYLWRTAKLLYDSYKLYYYNIHKNVYFGVLILNVWVKYICGRHSMFFLGCLSINISRNRCLFSCISGEMRYLFPVFSFIFLLSAFTFTI